MVEVVIGTKVYKAGGGTGKGAIQAAYVEMITQAMSDKFPRVNVEALTGYLKTMLGLTFKQAFDTINKMIIGRVYHPTTLVQIRQGLSEKQVYGQFQRIRGTTFGPGRGQGVIVGVGKTVRSGIANLAASNLRKDLSLHWQPLTPATLRKKGGDRRYFIQSGALHQELQGISLRPDEMFRITSSGPGTVGTQQSEFTRGGKKTTAWRDPATGQFGKRPTATPKGNVLLAEIKVEILPNLARYLSGLYARSISDTSYDPYDRGLEEALGISKESQWKLSGPPGRHRALIRPVLTYYTLYEAPAMIARALRSAGL